MFKINTRNIDKTQTVYLSGPMTGLPDCNRAAFNMRAEAFKALGYSVNNPADISVTHGTDKAYGFYFKRALRLMLESDVVYVFGDTSKSAGVQMELQAAQLAGMPIVRENEGERRGPGINWTTKDGSTAKNTVRLVISAVNVLCTGRIGSAKSLTLRKDRYQREDYSNGVLHGVRI